MAIDNRIKFRHLQCFLEVTRQKSVGRAAEELNLAQSAVSRTIAELEETVGAKLLERGRHGSRLTVAGEIFHSAVAPSIEQIRRAYSLGSADETPEETIAIGALPTVSAGFLPKVIHQLKKDGFTPILRVVEGTNIELLDLLRRGELSCVIGRLGAAEIMRGLSFEHLYAESIVCIVRPSHPLLERDVLSTSEIAKWPVVLNTPGTIARSEVDRYLHARGVSSLTDVVETNSVSFSRSLALLEDRIWIFAHGAIEADLADRRFIQLKLADWDLTGSVGMTTNPKNPLTPAVELVMKTVRLLGGDR